MSYAQQGPYLANYIKKKWPDRASKAAMVYSESPNFEDARDAFTKSMSGVKTYPLARVPSSTELATTAQRICADGMKVAYPLMAPKDWLTLLGSIPRTCDLQWAGVGLTMGLNTVASTGCKANREKIEGAVFFSPFPGLDKAPSMDPEFKAATGGNPPDDIYVALWTTTKAVGELIRKAGANLNRAGFVQSTENTKNLQTPMAPVLSYSPTDHFGARQVHVLRADCNKQQYVTEATFATF
jgi:branched-chain amino acid transport system substrate-binding protein